MYDDVHNGRPKSAQAVFIEATLGGKTSDYAQTKLDRFFRFSK